MRDFIGLEVAASPRSRELAVHVVAPEARPMERVLGPELGDFIRKPHEEQGVIFHLGQQLGAIEAPNVALQSGERLNADLVVVGIGVRPRTELAERAGLAVAERWDAVEIEGDMGARDWVETQSVHEAPCGVLISETFSPPGSP
jgi:NADPH-dependent 2,4-dienoyl-CoA reductase/sulfur reductase-like enzyme